MIYEMQKMSYFYQYVVWDNNFAQKEIIVKLNELRMIRGRLYRMCNLFRKWIFLQVW